MSRLCRKAAIAAWAIALLMSGPSVRAQASHNADLPDAPAPQETAQPATQNEQTKGQTKGQTRQPETAEEKKKRAQAELKQQEKQRILGVVPIFNVASNGESAPLTPRQKFQLMFKGSTDPWTFFLTAVDGGISMAGDEYPSYRQGVEGYAKYWAAAYADTFDGNFWGNAMLPSWWHEDPRYFRLGHGRFIRRAAYSAATTVWCKRDNGRWGPNYANVAGNFIAGGISNLYYPKNDRGVELTFARGASVTYEGIVGAELAEFWPDIAKHLLHRKAQAPAVDNPVEQTNGTTTPR